MMNSTAHKIRLQTLVVEFEQRRLSIESHVALMSGGVKIPVTFKVSNEFQVIPTEIVSGGIAKWRIFFADTVAGISAAQNSWRSGCLMLNHSHEKYDEYIYVISGKLRDHTTGHIIIPPEAALNLNVVSGRVSEVPNATKGWYFISAGVDHMISALEDSEFVVKFIRRQSQSWKQTYVETNGICKQ